MAAQETWLYDQIWTLMLNEDKTNFQNAIESNPLSVQLRNGFNMTLLHFAARNGDWPAIKILIDNGADLAHRGGREDVQTALDFAAEKGSSFVIALTVWTLRVHQKDHIPLLLEVLPDIDKATLLTQINNLQGEKFPSLLTQIIQQRDPEKLGRINFCKNKISDKRLTNALISISEQMLIPPARPLIHSDSPILNHGSATTMPLSDTDALPHKGFRY